MDTLQISTGEKRIAINGDESRVIVFNPSDVLFAEKFYRLLADFQTQFKRFNEQARELEKDNRANGLGENIPANLGERIELVKQACEYVYQQIDLLFGAGTSEKAFQGAYSLDAIEQFFTGISPYIQTARVEKIQKYTNKRPKRNR